MKKLITLTMAMMLMLTACGAGAEQTEYYEVGPNAEYEAEHDYIFEEEVSPLEGKWTDEYEILELVVDGNRAVLNGRMLGNVDGMDIDFPNDYKKTEAEFIDGDLYFTVTPFDWVLEEAGVQSGHTITIRLSKVEDTEGSEE